MSFDAALRATEILIALAFIQQSAEHLKTPGDGRLLFALRILASLVLLSGMASLAALMALAGVSLFLLQRFQGPYNGGSDRMGILILWCLLFVHLAPAPYWQAAAFGYLAVQLSLSISFPVG